MPGAPALARIKEEGIRRKPVYPAPDDPPPVFGGEAILVGGTAVAQATSGNFGYSVEVGPVTHSVEAFGNRSSASVIRGAAYDPNRKKILC